MEPWDVREYIMSLPGAEETDPFDEGEIAVYKIAGRWFACISFDRSGIFAVKCDPGRAVMLRDLYPAITPAWHFNKKYWNDLDVKILPDEIVKREIRHSYLTVIRKNVTPKALREELLRMAASAGIEDAGQNFRNK